MQQGTELCRRPLIRVCDGFLDEATIRELEAEIARQLPKEQAAGQTKHDATGLSFELDVAASPAATTLRDQAQAFLGLGNDFGQTLRYRRYREGESHPAHCDHYQVGERALVATALFHLADTGSGGETRFPEAQPDPVAVAPRRGRLVAWFNHDAEGRPEPLSIHDAAPVLSGEKITLTQFLYRPASAVQRLFSTA